MVNADNALELIAQCKNASRATHLPPNIKTLLGNVAILASKLLSEEQTTKNKMAEKEMRLKKLTEAWNDKPKEDLLKRMVELDYMIEEKIVIPAIRLADIRLQEDAESDEGLEKQAKAEEEATASLIESIKNFWNGKPDGEPDGAADPELAEANEGTDAPNPEAETETDEDGGQSATDTESDSDKEEE